MALATFLCLSANAVAANHDDAVGLHAKRLPAAATVWCLSNPTQFGPTARAYGYPAKPGKRPDGFIRDGGEVFLAEWARSTDERISEEFEQVCETAFAAFANPGGEATSTSSEDSERAALIGVAVGTLLTALLGLLAGHGRGNREDAKELIRLDTEFQADLARYLASPDVSGVGRGALVSARSLRSALDEWTPRGWRGRLFGGARKREITAAQDKLDEMLNESRVPSLYKLRDEGDSSTTVDTNEETLRTHAACVHREVAALARRIERFYRLADRKPQGS